MFTLFSTVNSLRTSILKLFQILAYGECTCVRAIRLSENRFVRNWILTNQRTENGCSVDRGRDEHEWRMNDHLWFESTKKSKREYNRISRMTKWNCIEDRVDNGTKYGRIIRKIVQGDIFADKTAVFSSNPIPANALRHLNVSFRGHHYIISMKIHGLRGNYWYFRLEIKWHFMRPTKYEKVPFFVL